MAQTVLSVVVEVAPPSEGRLRATIAALKAAEEATSPKYDRLARAAPGLHFMSLTVFSDDQYDPVFVLEANFDGPPAPFWTMLEAAIGPQLRDMLRCAKPPPGASAMFDAVTATGSTVPIAPLLAACTVKPAVFHQGNRGLDRRRIEREGALFVAARALAGDPALRAQSTPAIHATLRGALMADFAWLGEPVAPRIGVAENLADWARLIAFILAALAALALPGVVLFAIFGGTNTLGLPVAAALSMAASVAGILVWLRALEKADPSQDAPPVDPADQMAMAKAEDRTVQNHMISLVHVKPGLLRAVLIRAGLWGLGLFLRVTARDGYLATMRTIHFAHWALVSNGGRLMFHSNYDASWEAYLDDFIEKANVGLTLAWTNAVGLSLHPLVDFRWRGARAQIQGLGAPFDDPEPVLVFGLQGLHGQSDRASGAAGRWPAPAHLESGGGRHMGIGPVAAVSTTPGWGLAPACAALTQGLVVSPFAHLPAAEALFLQIPGGAGGGWLASLRASIAITDATGPTAPCAAIAFTWSGLAAMGLDAGALSGFSDPFREGMQQEDRRRRLGDDGPSAIDGGPIWSGDTTAPVAVHAVLLLYTQDDDALDAECVKATAALAGANVEIPRRVRLSLRLDDQGISREHFGFADGISQPLPFGAEIRTSAGAPAQRDAWHGVAAGDILIGHIDAHGEPAPGPLAAMSMGAGEALFDLGRNGSYLVIRELRQDVARFWGSMDGAAAIANDRALNAEDLAGKVVGRARDGAPLTPAAPSLAGAGQPANAFGFLATDPHGFSCPLGSHIRRANPRDGLARDAGGAQGMVKFSNNHRILRRGRKFGPDIADPRVDDGIERGLLFMCLNTDLARQFEFVQQNWLLNPTFATLFDETDPLLGPQGAFTLPARPLRRRIKVETFVRFAGGEYFFLPSLPALDYLAGLR